MNKDWIERLQIEHDELDEKITKLTAFINDSQKFNNIRIDQRVLLYHQLVAMETYRNILLERIRIGEC